MRYLLPALPLSLILAAPAAASSTAAAGPSATPLILELILAAVVIAGLTVRHRMARVLASLRRVRPARRRAWVRARGA
ncbi:MAG TPA: hypothetical protein VHJ39_04640 [Solirubrobacteraceae bacterium]|jgi:hypothetical protein|nr:hypothetical protein [Solirubrobacteraceae bacterium]